MADSRPGLGWDPYKENVTYAINATHRQTRARGKLTKNDFVARKRNTDVPDSTQEAAVAEKLLLEEEVRSATAAVVVEIIVLFAKEKKASYAR